MASPRPVPVEFSAFSTFNSVFGSSALPPPRIQPSQVSGLALLTFQGQNKANEFLVSSVLPCQLPLRTVRFGPLAGVSSRRLQFQPTAHRDLPFVRILGFLVSVDREDSPNGTDEMACPPRGRRQIS
jgi:hypothetical protein